MFIEQVVNCVGRFYRALTMAGSLGPFMPSHHMSHVPKPAYQWKVLFLPQGQPGIENDTALVWVLPNDETSSYNVSTYRGAHGLEMIEKGINFTFPARVRDAKFPVDSSDILQKLLDKDKQATCGFERAPEHLEHSVQVYAHANKWGPWNVINVNDAQEFPCPSY